MFGAFTLMVESSVDKNCLVTFQVSIELTCSRKTVQWKADWHASRLGVVVADKSDKQYISAVNDE